MSDNTRSSRKVAWIFPGQGSQRVGMAANLAENEPIAKAIFDEVDSALDVNLSRIIFNGPDQDLELTSNQQPAILAVSIAYLTVLRQRGLLADPVVVAGHSLGEYSALVAIRALSLPDAARIVRRRGELMQTHGAGAMAAIIGLDSRVVADIAREAGAEVANFNSPVQTVITGRSEAVAHAEDVARDRGAKRVVRLPVSGAFHSSLMTPVADGLRPMLESVPISQPMVPLVANVDAQPLTEPAAIRDELSGQISAPVQWINVTQRIVADGVTHCVEVGPGKVLAGLIPRITRDVTVATAESLLHANTNREAAD